MTSNTSKDQPIVVVGAGLVGAMTAILLSKRGYTKITVYDARPDPRVGLSGPNEASGGELHGKLGNSLKRSINLALSHRGICALKAIGLEEQILEKAVPMEGRMIHPPGCMHAKDDTVFQPYDHRPGQAIYSISREELNLSLLLQIQRIPQVSVVFGAKFESIDKHARATFSAPDLDSPIVTEPSVVLGADGAFSKVREQLGRVVRMDFSRSYISSGYKELTIPPTPHGHYAMHPHALHIWPRGDFMLIALPNQDKSFTATLFAPFETLEGLGTEEEVEGFFLKWFPDVCSCRLMPTLAHDYFSSPSSSLLSIKVSPWHHQGRLLLLGDAAHATVPFYGQGMNAGFEDALRLYEMLGESEDLSEVFARFSAEMVPSREGLVEVSLDNYKEMSAKTNSRLFAIKRRLDWLLESLLPAGAWSPLYTMVTFSRTHYHLAKAQAERQDALLNAALALPLALLASAALASALPALLRLPKPRAP